MMRIFQVHPATDLPRLTSEELVKRSFLPFDGSSKRGLNPREKIDVSETSPGVDPLSFWWFEPGVLVYSEALYDQFATLEDSPYYTFLTCGEFITLKSKSAYYVAINPTAMFADFATGAQQSAACNTPLFRLRDHSKTNLFCLEGTDCPGNEFKHEYDRCRLRGLVFQECWCQEISA
jgi:hypothetical protein